MIAEERGLLTSLVEGETLVVPFPLLQRDDRAVAHLACEGAVLFCFLRRDAVNEPRRVAVPLEIAHERNGDVLSGREVVENQIGSGILPLLSRTSSPFLRLLTAAAGRRSTTTAPSASTAATAVSVGAVTFVERDPRR